MMGEIWTFVWSASFFSTSFPRGYRVIEGKLLEIDVSSSSQVVFAIPKNKSAAKESGKSEKLDKKMCTLIKCHTGQM